MLKKYWKLIIFSVVISFVVVLFMFDLYRPIQKIPSYHIETLSGDVSLVENLQINTYVHSNEREDMSSSFVSIHQNENVKEGLLPFYKRLYDDYLNLEHTERIRDYRSFMRMKSLFDHSAETNKYLAYVTYQHQWNWYIYTTLRLDLLNKETGEVEKFTIDLKEEIDINDSTIESLILVGDTAYVVFSTYTYDVIDEEEDGSYDHANEGYDYYLMSIDLQSKKINQVDLLAEFTIDDYWDEDHSIISLQDASQEGPAFVGVLRSRFDEKNQESAREIIGVHYLTEDKVITEDLSMENWTGEPLLLSNEEVLLGSTSNKGTELKLLHIETGEVMLTQTLEDLYLDLSTIVYSDNQVIYFAGRKEINKFDTKIFGFTADSLDLIYEGELKTDRKEESEYEIYIMDLFVKSK